MKEFIQKKGLLNLLTLSIAILAVIMLAGFLFGNTSQGIFMAGFWYILALWAFMLETILSLIMIANLFFIIVVHRKRSIWIFIALLALGLVCMQGILYFQTAFNFQRALRGVWSFSESGYASLINAGQVVSVGRMMAFETLAACASLWADHK